MTTLTLEDRTVSHESGIYATVIADSTAFGHRLTTMEVKMHRFVLAEFNTHRVFSRNSASSRAIPLRKQVEMLMEDPALPVEWRAEQSGMQGGDLLEPNAVVECRFDWLEARDYAVTVAEDLARFNHVHKSIVNRLLEPFMWHKVIVSSTEWDNFFSQRCSPLAQPEIRVAAECMQDALEVSEPEDAEEWDIPFWHLPYVSHDEVADNDISMRDLRAISAARCARVSYLTHDGVRDIDKDLALYEKLVSAEPPHWSPLEHVATPTGPYNDPDGNFRGWHQLRHVYKFVQG